MSTITLPNIRVSSDLTVGVVLKDGGVAIDWSTLSNIKAYLYADAQRAMAGRCSVAVDEEDSTRLACSYRANKPQYIGVNRIVITCTYRGETKTFDKPALNFVRWTDDQAGQQITIDDPDVDVEISVEDVSSSILQEAVDAAFTAADRANDAAAAAEHMVDIHTGPAGKSPYIGENGHWYEWDEETDQYVDTETNAKGDTGETPDITIGTVTTVEPGTPAAASMTGTQEAPVLNLSIPKGLVGATPNITVGTVTTGEPGTPVVVTITGTPEAPVLNVTIPQGMQGNTGSSVDYPYELVNNLTTNDATKGLSAAQGVVLDGKVSQLEANQTKIFRYEAKEILVALLKKIAYIDNDVQGDVDDLEDLLLSSAELVSLSAVFTQGSVKFYPGQDLDSLKPYLVVTGYYDDLTTREITNYTLSGTLIAGTSTVTVSYDNMTTTFTVNVEDVLYYLTGDLIARQVALRAAYTSSTKGQAVTIGGVTYWFTHKYPDVSGAVSRASYYLFDILLTPGTTYLFELGYTGKPSGDHINIGLQFFDSTLHAAGVANAGANSANYNSDVIDSGWLTATDDGDKISVQYEAPSGTVGTRIALNLLDSSNTAQTWPTSLVITEIIIKEVE